MTPDEQRVAVFVFFFFVGYLFGRRIERVQ